MDNLYKTQELQSPGFFQRLFKTEPKENALVEVNNLLATKPVREIRPEEVEQISSKYKVDLHREFLPRLNELYLRYLKKCFGDNELTDEEVNDLNHLRNVLLLRDDAVEQMHNALGGEIYKKTYSEAISNGTLEKSKEAFLDKLQSNLRLPDGITEKISADCRTKFMEAQVGKMVEDRRVSPDEWEELNAIAKNLSVALTIDESSKANLEKFKLYWLIECGELPVKQVDINLQKSEVCYYSTYADWLENRTVTQRINYGGVGYRIKIMKGVYYRAGSVNVQRITSEQLLQIDRGSLYVTNKRIIFVGSKKNTNIPLAKILSVVPYSDGVGIEKDSGRSPILRVSTNADLLAMTLGRVINDL